MIKTKFSASKGFTLIEMLVVIGIIALLAGIIMVSLNATRSKGRDATRKANLKQLQAALESYYAKNGSYPSTGSAWWGEIPGYGGHSTSGPNGYIPNLAPTYIAVLPHDPFTGIANTAFNPVCNSSQTAYIYSSDGLNYKLLAHCIIESTVPSTDPFYDPVRPTWAFGVYTSGAVNW